MIILYLLAGLMINYDRQISVVQIFADDPAVLRVIEKNLNIPFSFPYDGKVSFPNQSFFFFDHLSLFEQNRDKFFVVFDNFNDCFYSPIL